MQNDYRKPSFAILYGAGRYAQNIMRSLHSVGLEPICFCDKDPERWGSTHQNLPVMSLEQAMVMYPESPIIISVAPANCESVYKYLVHEKNISPQRIPFYRQSCESLEKGIIYQIDIFGNEVISYCCHGVNTNRGKSFYYDGDAKRLVDSFWDERKQLIADNQDPQKKTVCTGCLSLFPAVWIYPENTISSIAIGDNYHPCQCSCIYCLIKGSGERVKEQRPSQLGKIHFPELLSYLRERKMLAPEVQCGIASAEITIHPQRSLLLEAVAGMRLIIMTNGIVFDPEIADLITLPGNFILLSLDAGTRDTYAHVKGIDAFDKVVENIVKYRKWGNGKGNIQLKYIMLPENKEDEDLAGFVQLASDAGIDTVSIVLDQRVKYEDNGKDIVLAVNKLASMARSKGLNVTLPYFLPSLSTK